MSALEGKADLGLDLDAEKRAAVFRRDHAQAKKMLQDSGSKKSHRALRREIPRREAEVEHLPLAVAVRRQHGVGLAGLQRADRGLHQ
jgi:hypothetical protein